MRILRNSQKSQILHILRIWESREILKILRFSLLNGSNILFILEVKADMHGLWMAFKRKGFAFICKKQCFLSIKFAKLAKQKIAKSPVHVAKWSSILVSLAKRAENYARTTQKQLACSMRGLTCRDNNFENITHVFNLHSLLIKGKYYYNFFYFFFYFIWWCTWNF